MDEELDDVIEELNPNYYDEDASDELMDMFDDFDEEQEEDEEDDEDLHCPIEFSNVRCGDCWNFEECEANHGVLDDDIPCENFKELE